MSIRRIVLLAASGLVIGVGALGAGCADGGPTSDFPRSSAGSYEPKPGVVGRDDVGSEDGQAEGVVVDRNGDGVADGVDTNGDGVADAPLPGPDTPGGFNGGGGTGSAEGGSSGSAMPATGGTGADTKDAGPDDDAGAERDAAITTELDANATCLGLAASFEVPGCPPRAL